MSDEFAKKKIDILVLGLLLVVGIVYGNLTKNLFIGKSIITFSVFTILPTIYLSLRIKKNWKKILVSGAIFGILFGFIIDFFEEYNGGWDTVSLLIPLKILGVDPADNIIAFVEMTILTIVFYQHFIESRQSRKISKRALFATILSSCVIIVMLFLYFYNPSLLKVKYPYVYMGTLACILPIILAFKKPDLIKNMILTSVYFFILYFIIEIIALKNKFWVYHSNYIGWVSIFGLSFPFEEFFYWMMLYAICIVSYYEVFINDRKKLA